MPRILAVADEVKEVLYTNALKELKPQVVVACGDLPFEYLEYLVTIACVPLLYVPGNHDPTLRERRLEDELSDFTQPFHFSRSRPDPGPDGCTNIDGRIVEAAGLRIAGLGGSMLYNHGPNQYTEGQMRRRALALELRTWARLKRPGGKLDLLVTHSPPLGVGDGDDLAHRGFACFHSLVHRLRPTLLIHGHIHPHGTSCADLHISETKVINAVGYRLLEMEP